MRVLFRIIVVGAGGTGGNLIKELGRFLKFFYRPDTDWSLIMVDGDRVEQKNTARQPFSEADLQQNKAVIMHEGLRDCIGLPANKITAIPSYIDNVIQFKKLVSDNREALGYGYKLVTILVGAVDNHRARQVLHEYYYSMPDIVYIDAANEFSYGEVVVGVRMNKAELAPPRAYYFPEVLKDQSPSASELSCGAINVSSPQHLCTNLCAATHCLSFISDIMQNGTVQGGILYFDAFSHFSRFDKWERTTEEVAHE